MVKRGHPEPTAGTVPATTAAAAVHAVAELAHSVGLRHQLADFGIDSASFSQIAADALDDEVLANAPRQPTAADIGEMLRAATAVVA